MNKYRKVNPEPFARAAVPLEEPAGSFIGGIVLDKSPQVIELDKSPNLDGVRGFEGGLRQDFGVEDLGSAAPSRILALGEHRFVISGDETFALIFRIYRQVDTYIMIESWDGSSWTTEIDSGSLAIEEVLADYVSYFDAVFIADGVRVYKWDQSNTLNDQDDDFTSSNSMVDEGDYTQATIVPGGAYLQKYQAHYEVEITGPSEEGASVTMSVEHDGEEVATGQTSIPASSLTTRNELFAHQIIDLIREIDSSDTLTLKIKAIVQRPVVRTNNLSQDTGTPLWKGTKTPSREAYGDSYLFSFFLTGTGDSEIGFYVNDGGGWVEEDSFVFSPGANEWPLVVDGLGSGSSFGLHVKTGTLAIYSASVEWDEPFEVAVHGFNQGTDGDLEAGVTYQTVGTPANTLTRVDKDPGAPTDYLQARYLGAFGNRILALQEDGDLQTIAWSVNGDPDDWVGTGSGSSILEGIGDPIDELLALQPLSSSLAALFRKRSVMRVQLTGNASAPFSFNRWLDNVGTESPFSVAGVPSGLMFLGHDKVVYFLSETDFLPIGGPIQEELEQNVGNLGVVEGCYDPASQEYILGVPGASGNDISTAWVFDFAAFQINRTIRWYRRTRSMNRLVAVQSKDLYYSGSDFITRRYDKLSVISGAYWESPTLNRKDPRAEYMLNRVVLKYRADSATTITIQASGDGGLTWTSGFKSAVTVNETDKEIRRAFQGFEVSGYDLRFRILYPSDATVLLYDWVATLVERGNIGSE